MSASKALIIVLKRGDFVLTHQADIIARVTHAIMATAGLAL